MWRSVPGFVRQRFDLKQPREGNFRAFAKNLTRATAMTSFELELDTSPANLHRIVDQMADFRTGVEVKDRTFRMRIYKHCFVGKFNF